MGRRRTGDARSRTGAPSGRRHAYVTDTDPLRGPDRGLMLRLPWPAEPNLRNSNDHPRRQSPGPHAPRARLAQSRVLRAGSAVRGDGARFRHLPRVPALCESVQFVSDAVRSRRRQQDDGGRRRGQGRLLESGRPVLSVRRLLHDEVPVRAAASLERRFSAPDAAGEGRSFPAEGRASSATGCSPARIGSAGLRPSRSSYRR